MVVYCLQFCTVGFKFVFSKIIKPEFRFLCPISPTLRWNSVSVLPTSAATSVYLTHSCPPVITGQSGQSGQSVRSPLTTELRPLPGSHRSLDVSSFFLSINPRGDACVSKKMPPRHPFQQPRCAQRHSVCLLPSFWCQFSNTFTMKMCAKKVKLLKVPVCVSVMEALRKKHKEELEKEAEKVQRLSDGALDSHTLKAQQQWVNSNFAPSRLAKKKLLSTFTLNGSWPA